MRIVIIERGGENPTHTHTYFIDDPEMFKALDALILLTQNNTSNQKEAEP